MKLVSWLIPKGGNRVGSQTLTDIHLIHTVRHGWLRPAQSAASLFVTPPVTNGALFSYHFAFTVHFGGEEILCIQVKLWKCAWK